MAVEFKLPEIEEAVKRLDDLFSTAFSSEDEAMQDWVAVRFALTAQNTSHNSDYAKKPTALEFARICTREGIDPMTSGLIYNLFFA